MKYPLNIIVLIVLLSVIAGFASTGNILTGSIIVIIGGIIIIPICENLFTIKQ